MILNFWADVGFLIFRLPNSDQATIYVPPNVAYGNCQDIYKDDFYNRGGSRTEAHYFRYAKANLRPLGLIDEEQHKSYTPPKSVLIHPKSRRLFASSPHSTALSSKNNFYHTPISL